MSVPAPRPVVNWPAIAAALWLPLLFWAAALAAARLAGYPGAACLTPLAWLLALPVGRSAARGEGGPLATRRRTAALAGALFGLVVGALFLLANALWLPPAPGERGLVLLWDAAALFGGGAVCAGLAWGMAGWQLRFAAQEEPGLPDAAACPACGGSLAPDPRYPRAVCPACADQAADAAGRPLRFTQESLSGGLRAHYANSGEPYPSVNCWVHGIPCRAEEAHLGGVVIQVLDREPGTASGEA